MRKEVLKYTSGDTRVESFLRMWHSRCGIPSFIFFTFHDFKEEQGYQFVSENFIDSSEYFFITVTWNILLVILSSLLLQYIYSIFTFSIFTIIVIVSNEFCSILLSTTILFYFLQQNSHEIYVHESITYLIFV